jgi:hypothetical protein
MDIVESQQLLGTMPTMIGGSQAARMFLLGQQTPAIGLSSIGPNSSKQTTAACEGALA